MFCGFYPYVGSHGESIELCLAATRPDQFSRPIPIDLLMHQESAVYFLGPIEACTVVWDEKEQARIITVLPPGIIYLTPDTSEVPGIVAQRIKIASHGNRQYSIQYCRKLEDNYQKWEPTIRNR